MSTPRESEIRIAPALEAPRGVQQEANPLSAMHGYLSAMHGYSRF